MENNYNSPIQFTPSICIAQSDLFRVPLNELSEYTGKLYTSIRNALKPICNYRWDNGILRWSNIFGAEFKMIVSNPAHTTEWSITFWNQQGQTSICFLTQKIVDVETDVISKENYKKLCETTEAFVRGKTPCSTCGTLMENHEIAGHYFAGVYCKHCWETTGVKEQAANENYE